MASELYQKISEIFQAVQDLSPAERKDFLAQKCGDNNVLRGEVESLLVAAANSEKFIESPALEIVSEILADELDEQKTLAQIGDKIGQYKIVSLLGKGGMSEVWLAKDELHNRRVALKLLSATQLPHNQDRLQRFAQEARAVSALNHPNIIKMFEIGQAAGWQFIAAEYVAGKTLRERLKENDLTVLEAIEIALQIAAALAAAHSAGIVHRDIKPENVMIRTDGTIKVLDFGLARFTRKSSLDNKLKSITKPGLVIGTIGYMSPEQACGSRVDERTDIFSLGIVLYEMLEGKTPFEGSDDTEIITAIFKCEPPAFKKHLPDALQAIIIKTLKKDCFERYQTAEELFADLDLVSQFESPDKSRTLPSRALELLPPQNKSSFRVNNWFDRRRIILMIGFVVNKIGLWDVFSPRRRKPSD